MSVAGEEVRVPKLGVSMTEATLTGWLVGEGQLVAAGEAIATIETDKVEQEVDAPVAGRLVHLAHEGEIYEVGELLAVIEP